MTTSGSEWASPQWIEAASVLAATVLAGIALVTQWADAGARRKTANAAIGAEAYAVRRDLRKWLSQAQHYRAVGGNPHGLKPDATTEQRLQRAVALAPRASRAVGQAIRGAYVSYYGVAAEPSTSEAAELLARAQAALEAKWDADIAGVKACIACLTDAIDPALRDK